MFESLLNFLGAGGILQLSVSELLLTGLVLTQITIAAVTIYLHRHQAHRALDLHPVIAHFFRLWLWLTTGMVTREWVAIHRKHHAKCETLEDPHSPQVLGIRKVLWQGAELYQQEAANRSTIERYGHLTPDDLLERQVYARFPWLGITLMLLLDIALFGVAGLVLWAVQMVWIPFWAAGVINGVGHYWGYRNYESADAARNLLPWGLIIGGEELHSNHHAFPTSARFSCKWWEFDLGWLYIRLLSLLGLAKVKRVAPLRALILDHRESIDLDTVRAVVRYRMHVMASYARDVIRPVLREQRKGCDSSCKRALRHTRGLLIRDASLIKGHARERLEQVLARFHDLKTVYQYRQQLQSVWTRKAASQDVLLRALQEWCQQAEKTGITALQDFSQRLRGYRLQPA
ncbi:MAG: fatty acid desaturase [Gammaproteobacteria bacterium]|nr:fatty acid desaturase [Gammaproteobacteria bacterium]